MRKKLLIPLAVLAVVAVALALRSGGQPADGPILLSGNIELTQVTIGFKTAGRIEQITVREGDETRPGMLLARLDRAQLEQQRQAARAAVSSAEAMVAQSTTALEWQRRTVSGDIEGRGAELRSAAARLRELEAGARSLDIAQSESAAMAARAESQRACDEYRRAEKLFANEDISAMQHEQARSRCEATHALLEQAQQRTALLREGTRQETLEAARAQVERARAGVEVGEANRLDLRRREQEIQARRADVERARAQLALIEEQLKDTVASSPIGGVVLVKSAEEGEIIAPGATVLTIGDIEHPWLRGYIAESDLGRVKLGQKVKISTDSYPGKTYWGRVTFISSEAEFTPKQIQTREERVKLVYRIKVEVDNPHQELKLNMPVDAEIVVE